MPSPFNIDNHKPAQSPPAPDMPQSRTGQDMAARTENGAAPPRKRQKIDLACEECRARKVRCDGLRPECSVCKRRKKNCIYLPESSKTLGNRRVLHSLHDRVACLEAKANGAVVRKAVSENPPASAELEERTLSKQSLHVVNVGTSQSQSQQCDTDSIVVEPKQTLPHSSAALSTRSSSEDDARDADCPSPNQDVGAISAMGIALSTAENPTDTTRGFYGKSSAASLLCDILNHGQRPSRPRSSQQNSALQPSPPSSHRSLSVPYSSNSDDYHLPPRHVADSLLGIYRDRVQIIYPFLHWQTFMEAYNRLWLSDSEVKNMPQLTGVGLGGPHCSLPVFYCALNAAFALATQFTDGSAHERKERSTPFLRRSRHLMCLDFLDTADVALVQALLIFARYLQSTSLPTRCWNVAGIAYRMAQGLGLHIVEDERSTSELDLEVKRRVWHSCMSLDTVLGMLTGRPISNSTASMVPLPRVSDENFFTYSPVSSDGSEAHVPTANFFAEAIKLSHILNRILGQIYDPWRKHEGSNGTELDSMKHYAEQVSITIAFDDELDRFEIELPEVLHWSTHSSTIHTGNILAQQRHVLRSRFLHIRLLLYRPFFAQFCDRMDAQTKISSQERPKTFSHSRSQLYNAFIEKCSAACIETAETLIDHIGNTSRTTYPGSPWYSCYYIYHAAIVAILADIHSSELHQLNHSNLRESWRACESFFSRMSEHNPDMYRYFRRLEALSRFNESSCTSSSPTSSCSASGGDSTLVEPREATNGLRTADSSTIEEVIVNHIADSYPDPNMALEFGDAWIETSAQPSYMESELSLCDDQLWTLASFSEIDAGSTAL